MIGWISTLIFVTAFVTWLTVTRLLRNRRQARRERWVPPVEPPVSMVGNYPTKAICRGCGQPQWIDDDGFIADHDRPPPWWAPFEPTDVHCEGSGEPPRAA
jgi:hypothetical protein